MTDFFDKVRGDLSSIRSIVNRPKRDPLVRALLEAHQSLVEVDAWAEAVEKNWPEPAPAQASDTPVGDNITAVPTLENGAGAVAEATEIVKGKAK